MRIIFFGNNWVGWKILQWLKEQNEEIVALVIHPEDKRKYGKEIIHCGDLTSACIFDGTQLNEINIKKRISDLRPSIGISAFFGYIISQELLDLIPNGCINIHPSFLPYNRGAYPNVWSIVEGTPAGASIHYINAKVDAGDIISQKKTPVDDVDTGESLYHKLEYTCLDLFKKTWPKIVDKDIHPIPQNPQNGTYHRVHDVERIDEIDLNRTYRAQDLINVIRARTFQPYPGAYYWSGKNKVYMRLQLLYEDELIKEAGGNSDNKP